MELEIMNGVTSEIFQSKENIQLSVGKNGELLFNGKNCSKRIPQLKPTQKSSDLVASCGPNSEEISLPSDSKSSKFVFVESFNNSIIDKFGKPKKLQKLTSKKKDIENNKSVDIGPQKYQASKTRKFFLITCAGNIIINKQRLISRP